MTPFEILLADMNGAVWAMNKVNSIAACRSDLTHEAIIENAYDLFVASDMTIFKILEICERKAIEGNSMPWEE